MSEENRTNSPEEELTQEDINSLKKIRMDKLEELKAKGKNPFEITKYDVTASCAEAKAQYEKLEAELKEQAGEDEEKLKELLEANRITVSVAGRVMSRRLTPIFGDILYGHTGINAVFGRTQCVKGDIRGKYFQVPETAVKAKIIVHTHGKIIWLVAE